MEAQRPILCRNRLQKGRTEMEEILPSQWTSVSSEKIQQGLHILSILGCVKIVVAPFYSIRFVGIGFLPDLMRFVVRIEILVCLCRSDSCAECAIRKQQFSFYSYSESIVSLWRESELFGGDALTCG